MAKTYKISSSADAVTESTSAHPTSGAINWVSVAIWGAMAGGLLMRCLELDLRPMHHDESIHATFAYQWMDTPDTAYYKYDPTYHGPFLYIVTRALFQLFGVGTAQARMFPLIFGLCVVFTPLLFRRWMGQRAAWASVILLAVSPLQIYYSRFLAHDMPSLTFAAASAAAFLAYAMHPAKGRKWLWLSSAAMGLLFSVKAVSFLYVFIYATAIVLLGSMHRWQRGERVLVKPELPGDYPAADLARHLVVALLVFCLSYGIFQTSLLHNPQGFADGLFTRVLAYWWGQHSVERLSGPTIFHLRSMLLHELPVLIVALVYTCNALRETAWGRWSLWALLAIFVVTVPSGWKMTDVMPAGVQGLLGALKIRVSADLFLYATAFVCGLLGSFRLLQREQWFAAFLNYWSFAALAIYSFAGEKTPWLTVHVLYPMALLGGMAIAEWVTHWHLQGAWQWGRVPRWRWQQWTAVAVGLLALAYQLRIGYFVNYVTAGEPQDLLSQVHNTKDVKYVVDWMNRTAMETGDKQKGLPITISGDVVWAFYFYLIEYGYKNFTLDTNNLDGRQRFVILDEKVGREFEGKLQGLGYRLTKLDHSGWWVPEHGPVTWLNWVGYAWNRKPPNPVGLTPLYVFYKPLELKTTVPAAVAVPAPPAAGADKK